MRPLRLELWLLIAVGLVTREQADVIDFLAAQVEVLERRVGKVKDLEDGERASLGRKAKRLSLAKLRSLPCIFKPATLHGWYRDLVAKKYAAPHKTKRRPGRPPLAPRVVELILEMAQRATYLLVTGMLRKSLHEHPST